MTRQHLKFALKPIASGIALLGLAGCISSPLPAGTEARLYHWDDRDNAIATREGLSMPDEFEGMFEGSLDFRDLPVDPAYALNDTPYLLESCLPDNCYYAVLFADDFSLDKKGRVGGHATLSGLSTAMYHDVKYLSSGEVKERLDELSITVMSQQAPTRDYSSFIQLDLVNLQQHRDLIASSEWIATAEDMMVSGQTPRLSSIVETTSTQTGDLSASSEFSFSASWNLTIDIDVRGREAGANYMVLCADFQADARGYHVNYADCLLRTPLRDGRYQGELKMSGPQQQLLVALLDTSQPKEPEHILWQREHSDDTLELR